MFPFLKTISDNWWLPIDHQKIMEIIQNQILTMSNKEARRIAILDCLDKKEIKETIGVKNKIKTDKKVS